MIQRYNTNVKRGDHWAGYRLIGGNLALDFVNTVGYRRKFSKRLEYLQTDSDLAKWAKLAGIAGPGDHIRAGEAVRLREALYRILGARLRGSSPYRPDMDLLNRFVRRARTGWKLEGRRTGWTWQWIGGGDVSYPLARVAEAAAQLLTSKDLWLLRQCADTDCGWLFIDRSQGLRRKWCSMQDCGNRAKVRRFFAKTPRRPK